MTIAASILSIYFFSCYNDLQKKEDFLYQYLDAVTFDLEKKISECKKINFLDWRRTYPDVAGYTDDLSSIHLSKKYHKSLLNIDSLTRQSYRSSRHWGMLYCAPYIKKDDLSQEVVFGYPYYNHTFCETHTLSINRQLIKLNHSSQYTILKEKQIDIVLTEYNYNPISYSIDTSFTKRNLEFY